MVWPVNPLRRVFALLALPALPLLAPALHAQPEEADSSLALADDRPRGLVSREELMADRLRRLGVENPDPAPTAPRTRADSAEWIRWRRIASEARGVRIVVSIYDRQLWLIDGSDTLLSASAGVGMGVVRGPRGIGRYDFSTPRGRRTVLGKQPDPLWVPPDWHYWGLAEDVRQFPAG